MNNNIGMLILRLSLGIDFLVHGIAKFQTFEGVVGYFQSIGLPSFMPYTVIALEILGGIGLIIGLGTRVLSVIFAIFLIAATLKVKFLTVGFLGNGQMAGWELDLALVAMLVHLAINNNNTFSLDGFIIRDDQSAPKYSA
jgi:uncharacterized membrane protein YphA (DoxX/SURF4 family)